MLPVSSRGFVLLALLGLCAATARTLSGRVIGPGAAGLRVVLNGGERTAITLADGSFSFSSTPPGKYLLEVASPDKVGTDDAQVVRLR